MLGLLAEAEFGRFGFWAFDDIACTDLAWLNCSLARTLPAPPPLAYVFLCYISVLGTRVLLRSVDADIAPSRSASESLTDWQMEDSVPASLLKELLIGMLSFALAIGLDLSLTNYLP